MGSDEILDTWNYEGLSSRTINTGTGVALCLCSSQWKLSGRRIFWCPQNCASRTNIFANIHFLRTKHIWCWWGHIMLLSAAFIQIQRLFIGNEEADYSREWLISLFHRHHLFPVSRSNAQLYLTGSEVHCPSVSAYLCRKLTPALFGGVSSQQLRLSPTSSRGWRALEDVASSAITPSTGGQGYLYWQASRAAE